MLENGQIPKVLVDDDCRNAPKKEQLRDFNIAYAQRDVPNLLEFVAGNIRWHIVGDTIVEGKEQFAHRIKQMAQTRVTELTISHILTHGNAGALDGVMVMEDGSSVAYCDVYRFSSNARDAKIKEITSYVIKNMWSSASGSNSPGSRPKQPFHID